MPTSSTDRRRRSWRCTRRSRWPPPATSPRLARLRDYCAASSDPTTPATVAALCSALIAAGEQQWTSAAETLTALLPTLVRVGGSAAQREVVEETLLFALVNSEQPERALAVLDGRLDRRPSPLDARRRGSLVVAPV